MATFDDICRKMREHGIRSRTRQDELSYLYKLVQCVCRVETPVIVELGTAAGGSAIVMAQALKTFNRASKVLCIDNCSHVDLKTIRSNFDKVGLLDFVELIQADDNEYLQSCEEETIDLVYIDSNHKYDHVSKTLSIVLDKMNNEGIISGHDYIPLEFGVVRAVEEWKSKNVDKLVGWGLRRTLWWIMKYNESEGVLLCH